MPYKDPIKQKQAQHESYVRNKEKVRLASKEARERRRAIIDSIKESSPCMDCGRYYPGYVMEFDHRDSSTKIDTVATLFLKASMDRILAEIAKCDLVCANCHRERTYGGSRKFPPE